MSKRHPRIYVYKITFEEIMHYYYGIHKERRFNDGYMGSPKTHKWMWNFYTPQKQILQFFDYTDEGYCEAQQIEKRLISPVFNIDPYCLNESCGLQKSLKLYRQVGIRHRENKTGFFSLTKEEKSELSRKTGKKSGIIAKERGIGIFAMSKEEKRNASLKAMETQKSNNLGIWGLLPEERSVYGKIGGNKNKENGTGIFSLTKEERSELSKKQKQKRFKCLVTGKISNNNSLSKHQNKFNIDKRLRVEVDPVTLKEINILENTKGKWYISEEEKIYLIEIGKKEVKRIIEEKFIMEEKRELEVLEKMRKINAKQREQMKKESKGLHSLTKEQLSENGKKGGKNAAKVRYRCIVTGFITVPGALTSYQKARGIDPSMRERIS